jgi:hypothetical protein
MYVYIEDRGDVHIYACIYMVIYTVCVYILQKFIYLHVNVHLLMQIYTSTKRPHVPILGICIYIYIYLFIYLYIYIYFYVYICTYIYRYIHLYTHPLIVHMCRAWVYVYIYTHICLYIYTYI